jgi:hypothetical protein
MALGCAAMLDERSARVPRSAGGYLPHLRAARSASTDLGEVGARSATGGGIIERFGRRPRFQKLCAAEHSRFDLAGGAVARE